MKFVIRILILWFLLHTVYTIVDGLSDDGKSVDVALILGSKVNVDGTLSVRLEKRLECGLKLYKNGRVKKIIVSGGLGKEGFYEGDKMQEYLLNKGVAEADIIVDNYGFNTNASVENAMKIKDSLNFRDIIVV